MTDSTSRTILLRTMAAKTPTSLEYALLGLLHQQPQSGYDLRKTFATTAMGNYSSSPGAIYPALKRLESSDLVTSEIDSTTKMRPRQVFSPNRKGRAAFRQWLREDVTLDDVARKFDDIMLRLAFHWVLDDMEATRVFVGALAEGLDRYVENLESQRRQFPEQAPIQPRLALDGGIEQVKAAARWARKSLKKLTEDGA